MITDKVLNALEYNKVLEILAGFARSEGGKEYIRGIRPAVSLRDAEYLISLTDEAARTVTENKYSPQLYFDNIETALKKAEIFSPLTLAELLKISRHLSVSRQIKTAVSNFNKPLLCEIINLITPVKPLEDKINKTVISESEISDNATDKLYNIRRNIRSINENIKNKLAHYIKSADYNKFLQDNIVTLRGGRYVVPVKQEHKGNIPGLIHDQSASGATVFIEPMAIVELNNELKILYIEEAREIERIIAEITKDVADINDLLFINNTQLIILDSVYAKADYALTVSAYKPRLNERNKIFIIKGRHPLLGKKAVPLDAEIDNKIMIISGPNTGGKTVALKTIGLFVLMGMSGMFIPAEESEIPVYESVYCDIGDEQSIENALSTFSSHMKNIIEITGNAAKNSLVLLDELGAGTDPLEGAALSIGVTKYLIDIKCTAVITTHFYELKEFSMKNENILTASMQFDPETFMPTYKLINGLPGTSNALRISKHLGLSDVIIGYAEENLTGDKKRFEQILQTAENAKTKAERELDKYGRLNAELGDELKNIRKERESLAEIKDRLRLNAKAETRRQVQKYIEEADELINELKEKLKQEDEKALLEARRLKTKLSGVIYNYDNEEQLINTGEWRTVEPDNIKINDEIFLKTHNLKAKVVSIDDKKKTAEITSGNITMTAALTDLAHPVDRDRPKDTAKMEIIKPSAVNEAPPMEIKLLGCIVADAVQLLEDFLYNAASRNVKIIRVVHGVGTGALKRGIHQYLRNHQLIESYRIGQYGEGGGGVTILTLK